MAVFEFPSLVRSCYTEELSFSGPTLCVRAGGRACVCVCVRVCVRPCVRVCMRMLLLLFFFVCFFVLCVVCSWVVVVCVCVGGGGGEFST